MAPDRKIKAIRVVCAIIKGEKGTVLLAKRGEHQSQAGLWEFPGGKIDPGETPRAALVREIKEELGIVVKAGRQLKKVRYNYPDIGIELIPFICTITEGDPRPLEHSEVQWVHFSDTGTKKWAPADLPVLEEYMKNIKTCNKGLFLLRN